MQVISVNCPSCGGPYSGSIAGRSITCEYCGTRYVLDDHEFGLFGGASGAAGADRAEGGYAHSGVAMADFAREACEKFLQNRKVREDASSFVSSDKVVRGLGIADGDEIFLIHDDTMFHSGKNGFAITREGFYCRELGDSSHFVSWEEFGQGGEPERESGSINQDGVSICYFTDDSSLLKYQLMDLYEKLYTHAVKVL